VEDDASALQHGPRALEDVVPIGASVALVVGLAMIAIGLARDRGDPHTDDRASAARAWLNLPDDWHEFGNPSLRSGVLQHGRPEQT
jgi:hypothetical protein